MSTEDETEEAPVSVTEELEAAQADAEAAPPKRKLNIEVAITDVGPCKKHLKITIPRPEIERQYEESLEELRKDAVVPGFRPGKAPEKLIIKRFKKAVANQVKSALLTSALEQIDEDYEIEPITQPRLDVDAIEIPESGPLNFAMDVEVRPQFALPNLKGLKVKRPVMEITDSLVDEYVHHWLEGRGQIVPKLDGAAEIGDYITADLIFHYPDGRVMNEAKELQVRLQSELRFQNGTIKEAGSALVGVKPGDVREVEATLGSAIEDPALRGATIKVEVHVKDLKQLRVPELTQEYLSSVDLTSVDELRDEIRAFLAHKLESEQRQAIRAQVLESLLRETPFDLPADLVSREERSTTQSLVARLRQEGMTEREIRARAAQIRANAHETTRRALQEYLLLQRIADDEAITVEEEDFALEIEAIAARTKESVRRVRARVEKEGGVRSLASQILERKVIDRILEEAEIEDIAVGPREEASVETIDVSAIAPAAVPEADASEPGSAPASDPS
jgi:trigger factor